MIKQCKQIEPVFWTIQWTGTNLDEVNMFFAGATNFKLLQDAVEPEKLYIHNDNQIDLASVVVGDYIVKELRKENFIVVPEQTFNQLYSIIEEE